MDPTSTTPPIRMPDSDRTTERPQGRPHDPPRGGLQHQPQARPSGPHLPTTAYGLVLLGVAVLILLGQVGIDVDYSLVLPLAMVVLGILFVAGAVAALVRDRRTG